jgi:hypothetical protein
VGSLRATVQDAAGEIRVAIEGTTSASVSLFDVLGRQLAWQEATFTSTQGGSIIFAGLGRSTPLFALIRDDAGRSLLLKVLR